MTGTLTLTEWLRTTLWSCLVGLYGLVLVVCGVVFPISDFLSGQKVIHGSSMNFHIYLYVVGVLIIIFLEIYIAVKIFHYRKQHGHQAQSQSGLVPGNTDRHKQDDTNDPFIPDIAYVTDGINFYMKAGILMFLLGSVLMDVLTQYMFHEKPDVMWQCYGINFIVMITLRSAFFIAQAIFIFRQHMVVLNFYKELVKLCIVHLMATNLCVWLLSVVFEARHNMLHGAHETGHDIASNGHHDNYTVTTPHAGHHIDTRDTSHDEVDSHSSMEVCDVSETLFSKASPFLFPFVIEFVLIAVVVCYKIYCNIGATIHPHFLRIMFKKLEEMKKDRAGWRKKNIGIAVGVVLVAAAIAVVTYYIILSEHESVHDIRTVYLYYVPDNVVQFIGLVLTASCFWKTSKLHFHGEVESYLDQTLLLVTLFGLLLLNILMIISSAERISEVHPPDLDYTVTSLQITLCALTSLQSCVQVAFIFDAMRRSSNTEEQNSSKPGRISITVLLFLNIVMWLINTFQLKEVQRDKIFTDFYGALGWSIIFNLALPLAIFYRFHSSVCLSDVVLTLYHNHEDCEDKACEKVTREDEMF